MPEALGRGFANAAALNPPDRYLLPLVEAALRVGRHGDEFPGQRRVRRGTAAKA
jgi:hypothetical protein